MTAIWLRIKNRKRQQQRTARLIARERQENAARAHGERLRREEARPRYEATTDWTLTRTK